MFKKKRKAEPEPMKAPAPAGRRLVSARLMPVSLQGDDGESPCSGEFVIVPEDGRVIVALCGLPEPWTLEPKGYTGYAAYMEEPGSGDRVRMDLTRVGEGNWASVRFLSADLSGYSLAYACPVGDGRTGAPMLSGFLGQATIN